MKDNPKKITPSEKYPRLEPTLEAENLVNPEMVGVTDRKKHIYSFVHQGKAVSFLPTNICVKDVNNLMGSESQTLK